MDLNNSLSSASLLYATFFVSSDDHDDGAVDRKGHFGKNNGKRGDSIHRNDIKGFITDEPKKSDSLEIWDHNAKEELQES